MEKITNIKEEIQKNKNDIYNMGFAVVMCGAGVISGVDLVDNSFTLVLKDVFNSGNVVESISALAGSLAITGTAGTATIGCAAIGAYKTAEVIKNKAIETKLLREKI